MTQHHPPPSSVRPLSNRLDAWGMRESAPRTVGPGATLPTEQFLELVHRRRVCRIATGAGVAAVAVGLLAMVVWMALPPDDQPSAPRAPHNNPNNTAPGIDTDMDITTSTPSASADRPTPRTHQDLPSFGTMHRIMADAPDPTSLSVQLPSTPTTPSAPHRTPNNATP